MAYSTFLAIFLGVPLAALAALTGHRARRRVPGLGSGRACAALLAHAILALAYTGPWDNYLVAAGVWRYDPRRVWGLRLGWVPLEEYTFFGLQALLAGTWLLWLVPRLPVAGEVPPEQPRRHAAAVTAAATVWLGAVSLLAARWAPGTYLALELAWALPPLALQLAFGADILWRRRRLVACAILGPALYLSAADSLAIAAGTWAISPAQSTGLRLGGILPVEELLFFTLTTALVACGMTLALAPEGRRRLESLLRRWRAWVTPHPNRSQEHMRPDPAPSCSGQRTKDKGPRTVIVGAGLGGLATAARLARAGCRVTVFEQQPQPGGRVGLLERDGFRFDTGATLYLMPEIWERTFADLGRRRADYYDLLRVDPNYRLHFHDGATLTLSTDLVAMQQAVERLEPGAFPRYLAFLAEGGRSYDTAVQRFLGRSFERRWQFFAPAHLPLMLRLRVLQRHYARAAHYFRSEALRQALTFQTMYLGSSPFESLATYTLLQYAELARGIYLPRGGMYAVVRALVRILEEEGAELVCNAPVKEILLAGSRAVGVLLDDGTAVPADAVVANADLPYVYAHLLPHADARREARRLDRLRYSSSAVMFYWGLDRRYDRELPTHHNVFLARDYRGSFEQIFRHGRAPVDPSFYIASAVRTDATCAPPGSEAWVVLVPAGHLRMGASVDWEQEAARVRDCVLRRLEAAGVAGVRERIVCEARCTPVDFRDGLNLARGSAFGLAHNLSQVGYFRPQSKARRFERLYFAGASTHPGTGLPLVLISARLAAERLLRDLQARGPEFAGRQAIPASE